MKNGKNEKLQKLGEPGYLNKNCWLVNSLGYSPYKRCQYCELKFRNCLFLRYQIISAILLILVPIFSFLIERKISEFLVVVIFTLVIIYGYFFNKTTDKLIRANFNEKKAKELFEDLNRNLQQKINEQTKEIKKRAEHLEKLLKMRSEFLDIASHQLRTPISVILGISSMFKEGDFDDLSKEEQRKFLESIYLKAKKLSNIVNDILKASELETEEFKLEEFKPTQVEKIIEKIFKDFEDQAKNKGLKFEFIKPEKPTSPVLIHPDYFEQAIANLVDNAIRYTPKGYVKIEVSEGKERVMIKIEDSGIGIPEDDKKKMFEKFSRAKNAVNLYTDGSGLGLFITKKIIDAHSGAEINFISQENKGTTFFITLPILK